MSSPTPPKPQTPLTDAFCLSHIPTGPDPDGLNPYLLMAADLADFARTLELALGEAREALKLIAGPCENFWGSDCYGTGRTPDAKYTADRWCDPCIARRALGGEGE